MKATGIVRRIDELGRVVIPKEIRRTLRIREGDPLEIFTDREGEVILKKYSPIGELGDFAKEYAESLQLALGMTAAVCDKDTVIAASGPCRRELMDKPIHSDLEELMDRRGKLCVGADGGTAPHITADEAQPFAAAAIATIICAGDPIGAVLLLSRDENASIGRAEQKATETAAWPMAWWSLAANGTTMRWPVPIRPLASTKTTGSMWAATSRANTGMPWNSSPP